jgi:tetratricopeptide (TPR) repeat protein
MEGVSPEEEKSPLSDEEEPTRVNEEEVAPVLQPTHESEWQPVDETAKAEAPEPVVEEELSVVLPPIEEKPEPAVPNPEPKEKPVKAPLNTAKMRDDALENAQAAMQEGNISVALEEYGSLVKKKRLLEEIIHDLREALYEYPVNIPILQMLGDAYIRAGRLQEALDTYTKAEELLR